MEKEICRKIRGERRVRCGDTWTFSDNRDRLLSDMEGWTLHMWGCIPGMEGARNPCKRGGLALHSLKGWIKTKWPLYTPPRTLPKPLPPPLLHQDGRVPPQSTTNGAGTWPGQPIERRQRHRDGSAPKGPQAAGHSRGGALRCFCCPPSSAELSRLPPAVAEPSRTQPSPAEPLDVAAAAARVPPSERASERAS